MRQSGDIRPQIILSPASYLSRRGLAGEGKGAEAFVVTGQEIKLV